MKTPTFKLNGKPLSARPIPLPVQRIIDHASKMKAGELLTTAELAKVLGYAHGNFQSNSYVTHEALADLRARVRYPQVCVVWGNAKTIRELRTHKELLA